MDIDGILGELLALESNLSGNLRMLSHCDKIYQKRIQQYPINIELLRQYNQFRLRNIKHLPRRPRFIIGGMNDVFFPNFHTIPLLKVADVISLTTFAEQDNSIDRFYHDPAHNHIMEIISRFPDGFEADLFWDNQVEGQHLVPLGLEETSFPCLVGFTHMFQFTQIKNFIEIFDGFVPLSREFVKLLRQATNKPILDIPFGLSWASMRDFIEPRWDKEVDLSITLGGTVDPVYEDYRHKIVEFGHNFQKKYPYNVVISSNLDKLGYIELLKKSKISVNVVSVNGPYNYRTCEIMSSGTLLFQLTNEHYQISTNITDYLEDGKHLVVFDFDDLEEKLLYYLEHDNECETIARQGFNYLNEHYNYEKLYLNLYRQVKDIDWQFSRRITVQEAKFHLGVAYSHYSTLKSLTPIALQFIETRSGIQKINNTLALVAHIQDVEEQNKVISEAHDLCLEMLNKHKNINSESLLLLWNYLACQIGDLPEEFIVKAVDLYKGHKDNWYFDDTKFLFNADVRESHLSNGQIREARYNILELPLLKHAGDIEKSMEIYMEFVLWHCNHYLASLRQRINAST